MLLNRIFYMASLLFTNLLTGCGNQSANSSAIPDALRAQALKELRENLHTQTKWEKVHAAEYLLWLGYPDGVQEVFEEEAKLFRTEVPYRIGIWRVLAQCSFAQEAKKVFIDRILNVFRDRDAGDRLHAAETLAKLKVSLLEEAREATEEILMGEKNSLFVYTLLGASNTTAPSGKNNRARLLQLATSDKNELLRSQGGYALRHLRELASTAWDTLAQAAFTEPEDSRASIYLLSAAFVTAPSDAVRSDMFSQIHNKILLAKNSPVKAVRSELAVALGKRGGRSDLPVLLSLLNNEYPLNSAEIKDKERLINTPENADVRSAAAYAILKMGQRQKNDFPPSK